ncbi:MAG TPA: pirin family protein [Myxococcota bacterium]|nr:pirin family protein [Myxococcota bacterium]
MIEIRRADERGRTQIGWLDSRHSFSFGDYHDPRNMGFGALRVINDDRVRGGAGFGTHGHRDMEILSVVLEGALEHRDSLGTGSVIRPGDVQRMSAGTGIRHSEFNPDRAAPVRFLQIWLEPERDGLAPSYEQRHFSAGERRDQLRLVASRDARDGSLLIHQDADVFAALVAEGKRLVHPLRPGRRAWLQVARGEVELDGRTLAEGDGAALVGERELEIRGRSAEAELLLFDLAE